MTKCDICDNWFDWNLTRYSDIFDAAVPLVKKLGYKIACRSCMQKLLDAQPPGYLGGMYGKCEHCGEPYIFNSIIDDDLKYGDYTYLCKRCKNAIKEAREQAAGIKQPYDGVSYFEL